MIAAADNQLGAQLSGINVGAMRSHAMSIATALAMIGGTLTTLLLWRVVRSALPLR